jgi:hypothetical protein
VERRRFEDCWCCLEGRLGFEGCFGEVGDFELFSRRGLLLTANGILVTGLRIESTVSCGFISISEDLVLFSDPSPLLPSPLFFLPLDLDSPVFLLSKERKLASLQFSFCLCSSTFLCTRLSVLLISVFCVRSQSGLAFGALSFGSRLL